jgi:tetratricopeptide (TPR) repeat protein
MMRKTALSHLVVVLLTVAAWAQTPALSEAFQRASQAMRAGNLDEAGEQFAQVAKQAPTFAEAHFNLGLVREEQGRFEEAIVSLQKAVALKPRLHGANLFLGIAQFRLNHLDLAAAAVEKETSAYPKDSAALMWLGVVHLAQDRPEEAVRALDKAWQLRPDDPDILYHRGRAHLLVSKNSYAEMFKVDSRSWRVHRVIAQASAEAERYLDAIAEYEAAIKLAPNQPGLHEELGSAYRSANKMAEAEQAFRRELEIDPHNVLARYKLGVLAVEKGDGATGKDLIQSADRERPGLTHLDYNLGRAEMLLGEDAAAAEHLQRATTNDSDPEVLQQAWYQLGIAYRRLHRLQEAQQAMATFQKLKDEEGERSQKALKQYEVQQQTSPPEQQNNPQSPQ